MSEINYEFRKRYSVVHKPDRRDPSKRCPKGMVEVNSDWCVTVGCDADAVVMNAARDLVDYFFTSMSLSLRLICECDGDKYDKKILYRTDSSIKANSYRLKISENEIVLCGADSRMAAQAGYFLEDLMNLEEGPYAQKQELVRTSLFNPRMVHSGYGIDMYPTEHLKAIAHSGISAILVYVNGVDMTPHGYVDFGDLCYRAAQYGIDVYAYSRFDNSKLTEEPDSEQYYEAFYGNLWDRCPRFKGLILDCKSFNSNFNDTKAADLQENALAPIIDLIKKVIYKRRRDVDIVLWPYNRCDVPEADMCSLIDTLPKDIALQATFDSAETAMRDEISCPTSDYTLTFAGAAHRFSLKAEYAKKNGLRLYSMTNAGGLTWDVGIIPYLPMPYQWIKRYEGMLDAQRKYGLAGTMDSDHFGFCPSFISDLAKWAFHTPHTDLDKVLYRLAARDFSSELADKVCQAYKSMSDGLSSYIPSQADICGPCRMGPSYPFVLFEHADDIEIPTVYHALLGGNKIIQPVYLHCGERQGLDLFKTEEEKQSFDREIKSCRIAEQHYAKATEILNSILPLVPERKRDDATRIAGLCAFIRNTMRTVINIKEFANLKFILNGTHGKKRNETVDSLLAVCKAEEKNALDTIPLVEFDSRLGYEPSMEYVGDIAHIEWKLALLRDVMEKELPSYYDK